MNKVYIWQQELWCQLMQSGKFGGYALLLKGRCGIGKFEFARQFAKSLLCKNPSIDRKACGSCPSCGWFEQGGHPNFYQVEPDALSGLSDDVALGLDVEGSASTSSTKLKKKPSQQISVDQIRALNDFINLSGNQDGCKIILIHPAETMNLAAGNALLKKLEEPPPNVLFILVTHRPQHLLPTIRSRCQQMTMPNPDIATATDWLKQQGIKDPDVCLAAAGFAPLSALLFNDSEYIAQHEAFIKQISMPEDLNPIILAEKLQQSDLSAVVSWLQKWCYDLLSFQLTGKIRYHLSRRSAIESLVINMNTKALVTYSRSLISTQQLSHHPLNSRLFLEEVLFAYIFLANKRKGISWTKPLSRRNIPT
ncbi:MAG: DNA polymerase III subunit delta' [Nitrosomonas sp.]|nr:DNA polymerase III subunit delta' [Nitrosomonas sp.]MDP1950515.1 DNA polymerase III subunit delta' [Nitrosomonas sp.]